jgi:5-methylcytosine-specific restriction endonuclease McrA
MTTNKNYSRPCPECNEPIFYKRKKDRNFTEKNKVLCRGCADKKRAASGNYNPKEEFTCLYCKSAFWDWRSQLLNPETPFCSKQCRYKGLKTLVGERYGRLLVLEKIRKGRCTFYRCKCDCGVEKLIRQGSITHSGTLSCGCLAKELLSKRCSKPIAHNIITQVMNYYMRNATDRSIAWDLTREDVSKLIFQPCFYCGIDAGTITKVKGSDRTLANNGIDRLDNSLSYTIANSVPCCKHCNVAKHTMNFDEFKAWAIRLVAHLSLSPETI